MTVMPSADVALPSMTSLMPTISPRNSFTTVEPVSGDAARSHDHLKSNAVTGVPSLNTRFSRSTKRYTVPSWLTVKLSAKSSTIGVFGSSVSCIRPLNIFSTMS